MPAPARTPRENWIDAGLRALAANGPNGVRVEVLADELGVTKGGFYGQFADRRAIPRGAGRCLGAPQHR